ncbi:MAG: flagellar export protein FliJ [Desulfobacteraceae bacterium 4572_35.1]|nr:MAG: flagellar export protein FliJ [Desulfobacteraceae bacterium 4572_35.1]
MKSFKLQAVLDHRQRLEDLAQQTLAQAIQRERELMSCITDETASLAQICRSYEERQAEGMHAHEFMLYENRINHKRQKLQDLDRQLGESRQQVQESRQALATASQEKKLLEKLKEKKLDEVKRELQRQEMIQIDEVAIMHRNGEE